MKAEPNTSVTGLQKLPAGASVRFSDQYLAKLSEKERKRFEGREGTIRGYRLQSEPNPRPIVVFPKFSRYREEVFYEMPWADITVVGTPNTEEKPTCAEVSQ